VNAMELPDGISEDEEDELLLTAVAVRMATTSGELLDLDEVVAHLDHEDLQRVTARALEVWGDPQIVQDWLASANAYLGFASPLAVLRIRGAAEVLAALDQTEGGQYA